MEPRATSLGGRQLALDSVQLLQQDESNKLLAGQLAARQSAKFNLSSRGYDDGGGSGGGEDEERKRFLADSTKTGPRELEEAKCKQRDQKEEASQQGCEQTSEKKAHLAQQDSAFEQEQQQDKAAAAAAAKFKFSTSKEKLDAAERRRCAKQKEQESRGPPCWCRWCRWPARARRMFACLRASRLLVALIFVLLVYTLAIYCLPFVEVRPATLTPLPVIPFNFHEGPLRPSSASAYKASHLFRDQLYGPESLAFDSQANLYLAVEGGFILWAHLNRSSPIKRAYLEIALQATGQQQANAARLFANERPELIKIAELNGPRLVQAARVRTQRAGDTGQLPAGWRRDCQLDEQVYGPQLYTTTTTSNNKQAAMTQYLFRSQVRVSRCSKPLGIRLSPDESALYVIDTLNGLYRVNLCQAERQTSGQRQVSKLIDFKANGGHQLLAAVQLDGSDLAENVNNLALDGNSVIEESVAMKVTRHMNVSLRALDDLAIDFGAGTRGGDLIYMTIASQVWPAVSFVYDHLEGRPSGLVLRFDTGANQLLVLEPSRLAHVRNSNLALESAHSAGQMNLSSKTINNYNYNYNQPAKIAGSTLLLGAPQLDENDQFDDRPLNFPNGLELMDDRQALLIADTSNKRILKHWIRGPRRGTTDLWAWTPQYPDNIRRGYERRIETYWVVGCGRAPKLSSGAANEGGEKTELATALAEQVFRRNRKLNADNWDMFALLHDWPRVRKFALKNIYFVGAMVEFLGAHLLRSTTVQDYGYELRMGSNLCSQGCSGMMVLQYNQHGDIIRSIHSREFPTDLTYYSQVNELIDGQEAEHALYLGSPSYSYVTKLVLPTETRGL